MYIYIGKTCFSAPVVSHAITPLVFCFFFRQHLHGRVRFVSTEKPDPVRSSSVKPLWLQNASCVAFRCLVNMIEIWVKFFTKGAVFTACYGCKCYFFWIGGLKIGLEVSKLPGELENLKKRKLKVINIWSFDAWFSKETYMVQFNIGGYLHFKQEKVISSDFFRSCTRLFNPVHWIHLGMIPLPYHSEI